MWTRLSPTAEFHLLQVQSGIEGKLFHGMQCVAFHSSLHLIRWLSETEDSLSSILRVSFVLLSSVHRTHITNMKTMSVVISTTSLVLPRNAQGMIVPIFKQFAEIDRSDRDECWHSDCYMINKVNSLCRSVDDCWKLFSSFSSGTSRSAPDDLLVQPHLQRTWTNPRTERKKIARLLSRLKMNKDDWNKKCTTYGRTSNSPSPGTP